MQLHIRHETRYDYGSPVKYSIQSLRLTPRRERRQRAVKWNIVAPGRRAAQIDAHGNVVHLLTFDQPHQEIRIVASGVVETEDEKGLALPEEGRLSPLAYLAETNLTHADGAVREFAARYFAGGREVSALLESAHAVCAAVRYVRGTTDVGSTAAEVLGRGQGVCQDQSHLYLACCRASGIPARYVSGYLYTSAPDDAASHAWVDVWLGEARGWLPIDVTHRALTAGSHCRLAVGRDYLDACPVRGARRGGGLESMNINVVVATSAPQQ